MKRGTLLGLIALVALPTCASAVNMQFMQQAAMKVLRNEQISYKDDVQPILKAYCISCHEPGGMGHASSGLDLSTYASLMKGTNFGKVVIPGKSDESTFTKLLTGTNMGLKMPFGLNESGTLADPYIKVMRRWVDQGAKDN